MHTSTADRAVDLMRRAVTPFVPLRRLARRLGAGAADVAAALERDDRFRLLHTRPTVSPLADPAGRWAAAYGRALGAAGLAGVCVVALVDRGPDPFPSAAGLLADTMTRLLPREQAGGDRVPPIPAEAFAEAALALARRRRGPRNASARPGGRSTTRRRPTRPGP